MTPETVVTLILSAAIALGSAWLYRRIEPTYWWQVVVIVLLAAAVGYSLAVLIATIADRVGWPL